MKLDLGKVSASYLEGVPLIIRSGSKTFPPASSPPGSLILKRFGVGSSDNFAKAL